MKNKGKPSLRGVLNMLYQLPNAENPNLRPEKLADLIQLVEWFHYLEELLSGSDRLMDDWTRRVSDERTMTEMVDAPLRDVRDAYLRAAIVMTLRDISSMI